MPDDELTINIGAREIYDAVQETKRLVQGVVADRETDRAASQQWREVVERRLAGLERFRYIGTGGAMAASALIGWLIQWKGSH